MTERGESRTSVGGTCHVVPVQVGIDLHDQTARALQGGRVVGKVHQQKLSWGCTSTSMGPGSDRKKRFSWTCHHASLMRSAPPASAPHRGWRDVPGQHLILLLDDTDDLTEGVAVLVRVNGDLLVGPVTIAARHGDEAHLGLSARFSITACARLSAWRSVSAMSFWRRSRITCWKWPGRTIVRNSRRESSHSSLDLVDQGCRMPGRRTRTTTRSPS